ncbi:up-regulator of cell proliferation-like [Aquarana catesbeiana]|uniref:up-regulator of cell proliferation-like n=1 Tax=Aquarana catesbeiana TaxID=8400 RepID=UPI003CC9D3D7
MATTGESEAFTNLLGLLNMEKYISNKLTLGDILEISTKNNKGNKPQKIEDVPWCTMRKIMALDGTARNTLFDTDQPDLYTAVEKDPFEDIFEDHQIVTSVHPLDVLCVLLHCSDSILQQEIVSKMAMCQFSVPLLLPAGDRSHCTLMLWALRDIVKKWRPQSLADSKGFREENVVNISMPLTSFVRLGKTKLSKSKTLNQVLNTAQQLHNFFIHDDMEGGNLQRKISEGLVEMSWYFPSSKSDVFPEPFAVTNLRGDLESNWDQFTFLSEISSAVFIFMETINEQEFQLLSKLSQSDTTFYFVVTPSPGKAIEEETKSNLLRLLPILRSDKEHVILKSKSENDASLMKKIQPKLQNILKKFSKNVVLEDLPKFFGKHNFVVDEDTNECQKARDFAHKITREIQDIAQYKKQTMKLQGDLWKQLSKIEKELCRMKNQGKENAAKYQADLLNKCNNLYLEQYKHKIPKGIHMFTEALTDFSQKQRQHFLKWMKFKLDAIARNNLMELQSAYKEKCTNTAQKKELQDLDQKLSDSSLGIEHFLRELGQFYEAESSMTKQKQIKRRQFFFSKLPGIAANLLLDGFPLELIDGDASNIPLQWITDILTELDIKTERKCKIRVITVLGVQSTGKSTLLNTMFGLQFPVASGRCTRGAFMTLLNVKKNFQEKLGCHFILVIDTEGLKAPELASLEDSYEHDNELATLVVGLSDITIVNMAMENTTQMKDILQIVVHAFLRMTEIGKKPNCQFVHQNVSDVSAPDKNMRDRKKLLEQLDEMTKVAAKMEKKNDISSFTDVMKYDLNKDNWYIPGLWQGDPPMAPVNHGYSSNVFELKMHLFEFMEHEKFINKPSSIPDFITWIESLWRSVKHEKFIFSFRNSLVAKAYNKLSVQYSLWEWDFCKEIHKWMISTENYIRNQSGEISPGNTLELQNILLEEENKMTASLEKYFENSENANLIEQHREEFKLSIKSLRKELERNTLSKCNEAVSIQKGKIKIKDIQKKSQTLIEDRITHLLQRYKGKNDDVSEREILQEFELMWKKTLSDLQLKELKRCNVDKSILLLLTHDMSSKGPHINEALIKVSDLHQLARQGTKFCTEEKRYFDLSCKAVLRNPIFVQQEHKKKISDLASSIIQTSEEYLKEKMSSRDDYNEMYSKELLHKINNILNHKDVKKLSFTTQFELDIKLFIFGKASQAFQKLHDRFIHENDPKLCLENIKSQYWSTFLSIFQEKDESRSRAIQFCELCLKPAIVDYIFKHLGQRIVDEILTENITFSSRSFFQCTVLEELLEDMSFQKYVEFISSYEGFIKQWILTYIANKYGRGPALETLQGHILSSINKKIKSALKNERCLKENSVLSYLKQFCGLLKTELVIPEKEMKIIAFHNLGNAKEFSSEIEHFLEETQQQIQLKLGSLDIQYILSRVTVKPQNELFRKVVGCGKQCPFCKVPCEAGGGDHKNHAASIHRPKGLGQYRFVKNEQLVIDICSTAVVSNSTFRNADTEWKDHPYKEYRTYYPDWAIQPDSSIECSDYWKFIFVQFNDQFAKEYRALPAELPDIWKEITREQALYSLKNVFNVN